MSTYSLSEIKGLWPSISCNIIRYPFADFYNSTLGNFVFNYYPVSALVRVRKNITPRCRPTHRNEYNRKIGMRLFILCNLQLEMINLLYKNLRKAECGR